jgi:hypothetical protein
MRSYFFARPKREGTAPKRAGYGVAGWDVEEFGGHMARLGLQIG